MFSFFFFNDTATTEIYPLSLHDALPISSDAAYRLGGAEGDIFGLWGEPLAETRQQIESVNSYADAAGRPRPRIWVSFRPIIADRKSTRLNSSHLVISYAVLCLKKKKNSI